MKAIDTNVLVRLVLRDDESQFRLAVHVIAEGATVPITVMMELEWVLRSAGELDRSQIADALLEIMEAETLAFADRDALLPAIAEYRRGADWADLIHLIEASPASTFLTFDRRLARRSRPGATPTVELIAG